MKITGYNIRKYTWEMDRALGDANSPSGSGTWSAGSILSIETDEGITGVALGGNDYVASVFPLLEGEDPRGNIGLWKKMMDQVFKGGNAGAANAAISSIDIALWDLKAKIADQPLWKLLGASEPRVKAYASGIDLNLTDDEIYTFYSRMADQGIDGGKLKVGLDMDADLRRIGIMNECLQRVTPRPMLTIDSNEYWSPKQAIRHISEIEKHFDITWVEEPARRWDYDGLRMVSQNVSAAVATGENINDLGDFYALIANEAVDIVEFGSNCTGITGGRQVANMAYAFELPVCLMNCPGEFMAPLAAALPNHLALEVVDPFREPCFTTDNYIDDGWIHLGNEPGLGLIVDEEKLAAIEVDVPVPPPGVSWPFPRREGAGLYQVPPTPDEVVWK